MSMDTWAPESASILLTVEPAWPITWRRAVEGICHSTSAGHASQIEPPPPLRTNRTRRILHPVLIGHAVSLTQPGPGPSPI
jgi:hypothetical protein